MILIYSKDVDDFVNQVIDNLGVNFIRVGSRDTTKISQININSEIFFLINNDFYEIENISEVKTIWFNGGKINTNSSVFETNCYQSLIDSFLSNLEVPKTGRLYSDFETNKLYAALEAQKQGFKVPDTLITDCKEQLKTFYNKYKDKNGIICKRIIDEHFYQNEDNVYNFNLTFSVDSKIIFKIPETFSISLFQERIKSEFEIRVVYIKGDFYSMSIHTLDNIVDCRTQIKTLENTRIVPYLLPNKIKRNLEKVFKNLKFNYGSADLLFLKGEYYFLEINPAGQISFVNEACNFYIENKFSKLLKNEAKRSC
ncbi:ATP-grasp domain-containing protein [Yeosuana marina]|uniref:hypothetical protein n=1 Tax=Yeosuana marina TaxID=1565536 RepID=UPI0014203DDE|nr:hypothetical protein [Yeosuana marina]